MNSPPSLRDLYIEADQAWAFVPPTPHASGSSNTTTSSVNMNSTSSSSVSAANIPAHQWTARPAPKHNTIFDLSPELRDSGLGLGFGSGNGTGGAHAAQLFKAFVASAVLQYTSTAIVMPWEVGKLLLQVQWVPRDAGETEEEIYVAEDDNEDALSDNSEDDSYFTDPNATPTMSKPRALRARTDSQGYIIRRSVLEEGTRPEYIIPVGSADGVWGMMKRVGRFRFEGWLALWKGLLTSCVVEVVSDTVQPMINGFLQGLFFPSMSPFHQPPIILPIISHLITGFLTSPLDLVRTRLIAQSYTARHRRYSGPLDAMKQILRDEGGLHGIYLHPHLLIPTLLDNALRPIVSLALPGMLTSYFGYGNITEETHPIGWGVAELAVSCMGLIVTLPIETVRRRLQVQVRGTAAPLKGCVELRPAPYNGVVDAFWHILTEERSDLPITRTTRRRRMSTKGKEKAQENVPEDAQVEVVEGGDEYQSWFRNTGLGQLYRGLGMRLGASAVVFGLALIGGGEDSEGGWAEI